MLKKYLSENNLNEIGIDEAGRGCLFGPVCIAAVCLNDSDNPLMNEIKDTKYPFTHINKKEKCIFCDNI